MSTIDKQVDEIFKKIDTLLWAGEFSKVDHILDDVDVTSESLSLIICYLTVSRPLMLQEHIEHTGHVSRARERLFDRTYKRLQTECPDRIYGLLTGLGLEDYKGYKI